MLLAETILSPAEAIFKIAYVMAAEPEAVATAPTPPSSKARRSSKTAVVGFVIRV